MKKCKIAKILVRVILFIGIINLTFITKVNAAINYREDGYIELYADDIPELSEDELNKVVSITIKNEMPNDTTMSLIEKCTNLENIYISLVDNVKLSFLNNIETQRKLTIYSLAANIDLEGISNDAIISINIANSNVKNFKDIENITTLETIGLGETSGYEEIDYTKFPNLKSLALATYIKDFDQLTASIPNITSLSLAGSNIQNKDTIYLERLDKLTYLNLNQTFLTDIDFVTELPNLETLILPWSITDLSPIYSLDNLTNLQWEAYTELFVTEELVNYLDDNNIGHFQYYPDVKEKINQIIEDLNITKETDAKEAMKKISYYIVENTTDVSGGSYGNSSSLDSIIKFNRGVCYNHSIALYTIAKVAGIDDVYATSGYLSTYLNMYTGEDDDNLWGRIAHAWNIIDYNGIWYSVDAAQMNMGAGYVDDTLYEQNFWKNPLKDDEYDYDYAMSNYLDFNYFYAKRHIETDGILKQTRTYQFNDITGLDMKNHVIYNYDVSDKNAIDLCSRVLDNYTCIYEDTDFNNQISTGDLVKIKKGNLVIETFTLSTDSWVEPIKTYLGKITVEYTQHPDIEITDSKISTLYYDSKKTLTLKIKGENYDNTKTFKTTLIIWGEVDEVYNKEYTFTGAEINNGLSIEIPGGLLTTKEPPKEDVFFGSLQYIVSLNIDDVERSTGFDYIDEGTLPEIEEPNETPSQEDENKTENPETTDIAMITIIGLIIISIIVFIKNKKQLDWLK